MGVSQASHRTGSFCGIGQSFLAEDSSLLEQSLQWEGAGVAYILNTTHTAHMVPALSQRLPVHEQQEAGITGNHGTPRVLYTLTHPGRYTEPQGQDIDCQWDPWLAPSARHQNFPLFPQPLPFQQDITP